MRCPSCGGECTKVISERETSSSGNFFSACCGYILLGPIGILCGFCGDEKTTTRSEYYCCDYCGKKFHR